MESEWEEGGGVKGIRDVVCLRCVGGEGWRGKLILWWISGMVVWRRGEQSIWLYSWRRVQERVEWWRVLWEEGRGRHQVVQQSHH
jgi:hypothetical protein